MKKLLSAIMVFTLLMSTVAATSTVVFAGTGNSEGLSKAIATVKKVIEIPDKLSEFEYNYDEANGDNANNGKSSMVHLNWFDKEHLYNASAVVSNKGIITSYYCHLQEFEAVGLAKITRAQAEKIAEEYLKKLTPTGMGTFKLDENSNMDYGEDYNFNYIMYVNDIPCDFINARIGINKYAGKLSSYNYNSDNADTPIAEYPLKEKVITKDEAKKIYLSELGPKLKYFSDYEYSKKVLKIFAAYETEGSNRAIDANSGKVIKLYDSYTIYRDSLSKTEGKGLSVDNAAAEIKFTEEELKEIQRAKSLIDKNEADQVARNLVSSIGSQKLESSRLREDWGPNKEYIWHLSYEKGSVAIEARTGTLISFNCYQDNNSKMDIGREKAKTIAENYLEKVCSDKKAELAWTNQDTIDNKSSDYSFIYTRQANGINFDDNSVYISVSKSKGEVVSYSRNWYENASFPKLDAAIQKEKAFDIADKLGNFDLVYKKNFDGKVALVYDFRKDGTYIIDAFKGVRLDYRGELYKEAATAADYTDIVGNWAEKIIKELMNNGYYLEGEKFAPKAATTQIEFFKYLYSIEKNNYTNDEDFYKMLIDNNIITKTEVNANAYITRQEAAKYIARYFGVDKLAKESSVFKNVYSDKIDSSYVGYASSVYAFGIMKGDSKGRFNGGKTLTHAETAVVIFNILNKK